MFVQKYNALTGEAEWVVVEAPGGGDECDADLVAASSYLDMLTDTRRNQVYRLAINKAVQQLQLEQRQPQQPLQVLDIGTGTGLLGMMAARALQGIPAAAQQPGCSGPAGLPPNQGADHDHGSSLQSSQQPSLQPDPPQPPVVACEVFPPMANLATRVIAHNQLSKWVKVVHKRSDELTVAERQPSDDHHRSDQHDRTGAQQGEMEGPDAAAGSGSTAAQAAKRRLLERRQADAASANSCGTGAATGAAAAADLQGKVDLIVTEIFDSELLGEGLLPTMRHAVKHLLKEGGQVIPARCTVYGQLVESDVLWAMSQLTPAQHAQHAAAPGSGPRQQQHACAPSGGSGASAASLPAAGSGDGGRAASQQPAPEAQLQRVTAALQQLDAAAAAKAAAGGAQSGQGAALPSASASAPMTSSLNRMHELHVDGLHAAGQLRPLSAPIRLLDFDLAAPPMENPAVPETRQVTITAPGSGHALVLWWQLELDQAGRLLLSTAPAWVGIDPAHGGDNGVRPYAGDADAGAEAAAKAANATALTSGATGYEPSVLLPQQWRDHWKHCWCAAAAAPLPVAAGQQLQLQVTHDDVSIRAAVVAATAGGAAGGDSQKPAADSTAAAAGELTPLHEFTSPARLWQLRDVRWAAYAHALANVFPCSSNGSSGGGGVSAVLPPGQGCEIVCVGDGPVLPLLAAASASGSSNSKVTVLQDGEPHLRWLRAGASALDLPDGLLTVTRPRPYLKRAEHAAAAAGKQQQAQAAGGDDHQQQQQALLLLAEPFYRECEGLLPWAQLRFWHEFDLVRLANPGRHVVCMPHRARLCGVAVSLPQLSRTRQGLEQVEGFDLSPTNRLLGASAAGAASQGTDQTPAEAAAAGSATAAGPAARAVPLLPYAAWQCGGGYVQLSEAFEVMQLEVSGPVRGVRGSAEVQLRPPRQPAAPAPAPAAGASVAAGPAAVADAAGVTAGSEGAPAHECHALLLWLDYDLLPSSGLEPPAAAAEASASGGAGTGSGQLRVSHAPHPEGLPTNTLQAVYLLPQPLRVPASHSKQQPQQQRVGGGGAGASAGGEHADDAAAGAAGSHVLRVTAVFDPEDGDVEVEVELQ